MKVVNYCHSCPPTRTDGLMSDILAKVMVNVQMQDFQHLGQHLPIVARRPWSCSFQIMVRGRHLRAVLHIYQRYHDGSIHMVVSSVRHYLLRAEDCDNIAIDPSAVARYKG